MNDGIAIVGMGCRFPDARSPDELWENVLARRQAFRRLPDERLRLDDYRQGTAAPVAAATAPATASGPGDTAPAVDPDSIYLREAAVLAGWEFDRLRFRVAGATFRVTDLTHWLALEVAAATLADAGFEDGAGLPHDATGVLVGNTLTGEFSRAQLMRMRWPYVRRVLGAALAAEGWTAVRVGDFLARLEPSYKAPFPAPTEESLAGGLSNTIAGRICNHFDLHGGGYTMDGACASSLLAVAQACSALAAGDLDVALAGGVDLSLDPFELIGFARAGALAAGDMRVFDARSAGFLPGEGCGFVALMREEQAIAMGRRIHGVIRGWGISSDGHGGLSRPEAAGQRLAIARAYRRAGFDIGTVACFEGHGTGTTVGDAAELAALAGSLRASAPSSPPPAAIGSIKANIGHTKAAAGIAGLLKATLAVERQVLPPATGCEEPHAALTGADPVLRVLAAAEPWPAGRPLRAGVSAMGFGGVNAHVVVEGPAAARWRGLSARERLLAAPPQDVELALLEGADAAALAAAARQLAALAPRLSRAELGDVAAALHRRWRDAPRAGEKAGGTAGGRDGRGGGGSGSAGDGGSTGNGANAGGGWRAAIVAATPRELADRTALLLGWLERGVTRRLDPRQGVFLGVVAPGATPPRVGLLFTGQGSPAYAAASGAMGRGAALARRFAELDGLYGLAADSVTGIAAGAAAAAGAKGDAANEAAAAGGASKAADRVSAGEAVETNGAGEVTESVGAGKAAAAGSAGKAAETVSASEAAETGDASETAETGGAGKAAETVSAGEAAETGGASEAAETDGAGEVTESVAGKAAETVSAGEAAEMGGAGEAAETDGAGKAAAADAAGQPGAAGDGAADRGLDTAVAQPAIVAHSLAGAWLLDRLAVHAGIAVGHSLGEISALCWAGACTAAAALRLAAARGRAMAERGEPGAMASLGAPPAVVAEILDGLAADDVSIAAYNGAARTVVTGAPAAVAAVVERAAARGLTASLLKVTRAFHSPRVAAAAADLDRVLATVAWAPLRHPVASTVSGALLAPGADLRRLLLEQVTAPVRFTAALAAARPLADLWIEVGPGRTLAELAAEALDETVLALDAGSPSLAGPWSAAAALFAAGVPFDVDVLFEGHFHRPFDLDAPLRFLANPCESAPIPVRPAAGAAMRPAEYGAAMRPVESGPAMRPDESGATMRPAESGPAMRPDAARFAEATHPLPATEPAALLASTEPSDRRPAAERAALPSFTESSDPRAFTARAEALAFDEGANGRASDQPPDVLASAGPTQPPAVAAGAAAPPVPIELLRGLVAARAELPASAVRDDSRLLSDLHLNSITVGQLVVEASRRLGLGPPASPTDYALATVAEVAAALAERARLELAPGRVGASGAGLDADPPVPAGVAGIDSWVRPFTVDLVERPLPPNRQAPRSGQPAAAQRFGASPRIAGPDRAPVVAVPGDSPGTLDEAPSARDGRGWRVIAPGGHPLAPAIAAALAAAGPQSGPEAGPQSGPEAGPQPGPPSRPQSGPRSEPPSGPKSEPATLGDVPGVLLCLPGQLDEREPGHLELFVTAARAAAGPPAARRLVVVQHGGGGGGFARTVHLELPGVTTWLIDLPANADPAAAAAWVAAELAASGDRTDRDAGRAYVEAHYDAAGTRRVPMLRLLPVRTGPPPTAASPSQAGAAVTRLLDRSPVETAARASAAAAAADPSAAAAAAADPSAAAVAAANPSAAAAATGAPAFSVLAPSATTTVMAQAAGASATAPPTAATGAPAAASPAVSLATAPAMAGDGAFAGLGSDDVLLVTGGGKGIGAECALAVARSAGARLAILGRSDPRHDPELAANLERMAAAGIRTLYLRADVADEAAVQAAIARADAELGPVTALLHAAGVNTPRTLGAIDEEGLRRTLAPKVAGARHLLAALASRRPDRLRLIVGFGSIIARTGLRGEAEYALANEWLALLLARHAARHPACRCLLLDWSVWSGTGMGERLGTLEALTRQGIVPIPPGAGVAELLRLLADPAVRGELVVTGRFGDPPTLAVERPALPLLRFLEQPRVYFPGVELVADVAVSADSDPYLSDHVFRGEPLFAAVVGLEAMAQAAAAVTGAKRLPVFEQVELLRPVAVAPGRSTTLRLAALVRAPGRVEVALRDRQTGFATDHFRALCRFDLGDLDEGSLAMAMAADAASARSTGTGTAGTALRPSEPPPLAAVRLAIDPQRDLYGGILFQEGRFRRLGGYRRLRATECLAEIVPDGTAAWFGRYLPPMLLLGDPAARDAAIHGIQACIPHAQLLPIGIERILAGRLGADEPLLFAARERRRDGDSFVYDLDILAADGSLRERWQGLRLRAVDRTRLPAAWSAPLLGPYLERRLQELFPEANLRVALEAPAAPRVPTGTEPSAGGRAPRPGSAAIVESLVAAGAMATSALAQAVIRAGAVARAPSAAGPMAPSAMTHVALATDPMAPGAGTATARVHDPLTSDGVPSPAPRLFHRPDGRPEIPGGPQVSVAHAASLVLAIAGERHGDPIGCDLEPVVERTAETWRDLLGGERFALAQLIASQPGELPGGAATRIWTATESLHKAGSAAGAPLLLEASLDDGWLLLRSGTLRIASFATTLRELGGPCALAIAAPAGDPGRHPIVR
jgi:acyl transferase domain-containing protein